LNNDGRTKEFGYEMLNGIQQTVTNASLLASYEWKENIFIDAHILLRKSNRGVVAAQDNLIIGLGFRMNLWFRDYDY
jgi:hypothetical protein